jgi:hypothetical protein
MLEGTHTLGNFPENRDRLIVHGDAHDTVGSNAHHIIKFESLGSLEAELKDKAALIEATAGTHLTIPPFPFPLSH